ncbi:MAG TPA: hypothetical protein H9776_07015 [Candidatus Mediterraneibacter intestinipullorum]|nr:hypothetical protein [Candidatus Mediterraneibacter intestinipullorum]
MKKRKRRIFFLVILLFVIGSKIVKDIQISYMRANSEEYRLIDDVLKEYGTGLYPLEVRGITIDEGKKTIGYSFRQKMGLDIFRKDFTWEDAETMRELMNAYLAEHPDYYLNDGYSINVNIQQANQVPWMGFTNDKSHLWIEGVDGLYDGLDCILIDRSPDEGKSLHVPVEVFKGAKGFYFDSVSYLEANYEAVTQMNSVEYYNASIPENTAE